MCCGLILKAVHRFFAVGNRNHGFLLARRKAADHGAAFIIHAVYAAGIDMLAHVGLVVIAINGIQCGAYFFAVKNFAKAD